MVRCSQKWCKKLFSKLMQRNPPKQCFKHGNFINGNVERCLNCSSSLCASFERCVHSHQIRTNGAFIPGTLIVIANGFFPAHFIDRQISRLSSACSQEDQEEDQFWQWVIHSPESWFSFLFSISFFRFASRSHRSSENKFVDLEIHCSLSRFIYFLSSRFFFAPLTHIRFNQAEASERVIINVNTEQSFVCFSCGMIMLKLLKFYASFESAFADDLFRIWKQCVSFCFFLRFFV